MKPKILVLTFSLFLASLQFFGQGTTNMNFSGNSAPGFSTRILKDNDIDKVQNVQDVAQSTMDAIEVLRLSLTSDATSYSDEAIVIFNNSDPTQGAAKLMSFYATAPELWSVKNGDNYSISFLGGLDSSVIVPISVKAGLPGNYTIAASQTESFGADIEISLEDRIAGTLVNLRNASSDYTFRVDTAATIADRFYLHFVDVSLVPPKDLTSVPEKEAARNYTMYAADGAIMIKSFQQHSGKIVVFDLNGRKIATDILDAGANTQIDMHGRTGVYIVSVLCDKKISNTKIIVR